MTGKPLLAIDVRRTLADAQLPGLPQSAVRLLELSRDPENGPSEFAVPIEADPGLAGQVLRFVNSSYFGFSRKISSVHAAIALVGVHTIKNFTLWTAVFSVMPDPKCGPFDLKSLWQDSLRRALFARAAAKILGADGADEVFSSALLQDMAVPLLARELPGAYAKLLAARDEGRSRLSALEHRVFGWTHAEAAAIMTRQWNLPEDVALLIENHPHAAHPEPGQPRDPRAIAVAMSALLPTVADPAWTECDELETCYDRLRPAGAASLGELFDQIDLEFAEFAPALRIAQPGKSLVDCHTGFGSPAV
jgi:HD-like signal output (HDOD) protein